MTKKFSVVIGSCLFFASLAGCQAEAHERGLGAEAAFEMLMSEGMSCQSMAVLMHLPELEANELRDLVHAAISIEQINDMIENRERGCGTETSGASGPTAEALTSMYTVVFVPTASGASGVSPTTVFRDSPSSSWMCNSGSSEYPADFVAQYHLGGAYTNATALRVRGTNVFAGCYLHASNGARVYSDDDVRMCIGYWHVFWCGAVTPLTSETRMWR